TTERFGSKLLKVELAWTLRSSAPDANALIAPADPYSCPLGKMRTETSPFEKRSIASAQRSDARLRAWLGGVSTDRRSSIGCAPASGAHTHSSAAAASAASGAAAVSRKLGRLN